MSGKSCLCSPAFMLGMSKSHTLKGNNREKLCTGYSSEGHGILNFFTSSYQYSGPSLPNKTLWS